jgi:hypothetical protein
VRVPFSQRRLTRSSTLNPLVSGEPVPIEQLIEPTVIEPPASALIDPTAAETL